MNSIKLFFKAIYKFFLFIFSIFKLSIDIVKFFFKGLGFILGLIKKAFSYIGHGLRKLFKFSLTFKITFVYAVIISFILFLSSISILVSLRFFLIHDTRQDLKENSDRIIGYLEKGIESASSKIDGIAEYNNLTITIFDASKNVIYRSNDDSDNISFYEDPDSQLIIHEDGTKTLALNNKIYLGTNILYLQLSEDVTPKYGSIDIAGNILLIVNFIGIIIIIIIGFKLSKRMLKPIKTMTETAKAITTENLDTRLDIDDSYDELRDLAVTFNKMFDRIQVSYEKQNQFVSDASHELRTPISVIQGYINLLDRWGKGDKEILDESIGAIKGESEAMKNLIEKLLFLARSDKSLLNLQKEDFYIGELIDEITYETKLIDSKHEIISKSPENLMLNADRKLIKQAIRIFIDNSVKFTPEGGTIKICSYPQKRQLLIIVEDTGIGIAKEDIDQIFHRFYRSDKSRAKETGGHGLGLSIAKFIIDEHGGCIKVESKVNVGTKIKILLPYRLE